MLVSSLRHHSANEEYVRRYLERRLGMDSFTLVRGGAQPWWLGVCKHEPASWLPPPLVAGFITLPHLFTQEYLHVMRPAIFRLRSVCECGCMSCGVEGCWVSALTGVGTSSSLLPVPVCSFARMFECTSCSALTPQRGARHRAGGELAQVRGMGVL